MDPASKEILIYEVVAKLTYFTKLYGIESLFIVGGFCRELYYGTVWKSSDIDVASAFHDQAIQLGNLFASEVLNTSPEVYKRSGAAAVNFKSEAGEIRIEFQGHSVNQYMHNQEVRQWMHNQGIEDVPLMNNIYGRDFTINSMIYALDDEKVYDPTGLAVEDLERKIISSLIPSDLLVKYNPLAILRAIRFALTYDFHIDDDMRSAMKAGTDNLCNSVSAERIIKEIVRILKIDAEQGIEMLQKYNMGRMLLVPELKQYLGGGDD